MRVDRHMLNWGIFFVCLGALPLAVQEGAISRTLLTDVGRLWPLIIVVIGVSIVLARTPADFVGGMLVAASFGLVIGGLFAAGPGIGIDCGSPVSGTPVVANGTFGSAAAVTLELSCGRMNVTTAPGNGWSVSTTSGGGVHPAITTASDRLSVRPGETGFFLDRSRSEWDVTLPQGPALALDVSVNAGDGRMSTSGANVTSANLSVNAGSGHFDLAGATVATIHLSVNLGSGSVTLGSASDVAGSISTNLSSLDLCTPPDLGLRIQLDQSLGSSNLSGAGLSQSGDVWQSASYGSAAHRANLSISNNLSSLTLNPAGGCR